MGFFKRQGGGGVTYANVANGFIVIRCKEGDEGAESRKLEKGKNKGSVIWERKEEGFQGHLVDAYIEEGKDDFPSKLCLKIKDKTAKGRGSEIVLSVPDDSRYARKFCAICNNIDLQQPILVLPYSFADKEKKDRSVVGWNIAQGGQTKDYFVGESIDREDMPEVQKIEKRGKPTVYDYSDLTDFLLDIFNEWKEKTGLGKESSDDDGDEADDADDDDDDETPF